MGALVTRYDNSLTPRLRDPCGSSYILEKDSPVAYESDLQPSEFDEEEIAELAAQAEEAELWADLELEAGAHDVLSLGDILDMGTQVNRDEDVDMT